MVRRVAGAAALVLVVLAIVSKRSALVAAASKLSTGAVVLAELAVGAGLFASLMCWRALLADLGSALPVGPALKVFFLGQLGKYIPGSVWPLVAQMELGKEHDVPRARSGTVGLLTVAVTLVAGLLVAALTLPFTSAAAISRYGWFFLAVPVLGLFLLPAVFNPVLNRLLRLVGRGGLSDALTGRGMARAVAWGVLSWGGYGLQVFVLARSLGHGGPGLLPLCIGAFALAWAVGFLVVVAPAGAVVREAALVLGLAPALGRNEALLVALASRALMTLGDLLAAGLAVLLVRRPARSASRG